MLGFDAVGLERCASAQQKQYGVEESTKLCCEFRRECIFEATTIFSRDIYILFAWKNQYAITKRLNTQVVEKLQGVYHLQKYEILNRLLKENE